MEIPNTPQKGAARNIARKLLKDAQVKDLPVSLWKVLNFLKTKNNLQIYGYAFGEKVSGMLLMVGEEATIGFNNSQPWCRRRSTISHEIGHLLMGHTCRPEDKGSIQEIEANQFAAELLVPLMYIRKDFKASQNLDELSKKYAVSKELLTRHLIECRLI